MASRKIEKPRIVIIGAGVGGLAAAAVLAPRADVTVLERGDGPGGKIRAITIDNQPIDSGPTVMTLREIFDDIFQAAGARLDDYIDLEPVDVLSRNFWPSSSPLDLYADIERTAEAIAAFSSRAEADRYRAFAKDAERAWTTLYQPFMRQENPSFLGLMARAGPFALSKLDPYTSLWRALSKKFKDDRLRQLFARYATYCGSSPFEASATLMLIAHVERMGVYAPVGGMAALAKALEALAEANGAAFQYNTDVTRILYNDGAPAGVETADGRVIKGGAVIFNGDVAALPKTFENDATTSIAVFSNEASDDSDFRKDSAALRSQSAMTWSFLGRAGGAPLSLHNVFFSDDYKAEFDDVFKRRQPPSAPTVYLHAPDRSALAAARASSETAHLYTERFFCLINAPADGDTRTFPQEEIDQCQMRTFAQLKRCGVSLQTTPQKTATQTPTDFAARFPATGGALFGTPNHGWRAAFQRRGVKTRRQGLYCAGGSVHPGSGAPMAALSGLMAAQTITKDYALT
ncbi:MAG: phytoene desaturase family protein [Pseudomonadota bacterium]